MNTNELTKKSMLTGAVVGIIMFAIVGLFPSSFIGGVIGLNIVGYLFGMPVGTELLSRTVVGITMVLGIAITGLAFIFATSFIGWLFGHVCLSIKARIIPKTI